MPRILCPICRYSQPMIGRIAGVTTMYLHCTQGVVGAPYRIACSVFIREPGSDDEWPSVRLCGRLPTRYPIIAAT